MDANPRWITSPELVKIWPNLGLAAIRALMGGAFRIWVFAKSLDSSGSGVALQDNLWRFCENLGIHRKSFLRWKDSALEQGLLREVFRSKSQQIGLVLTGHARAAQIFGGHQIGYPVLLPADLFAASGWRAWVWAAFQATFVSKPISRAKLREISGVPEQTQRDYERQVSVIKIRNFATTNFTKDYLAGFKEFERSYAFAFKDKYTKGEVIAYQLPNSYHPPKDIKIMPKGRSRKIQKSLNAALFIVERGRSMSPRLYHDTQQGIKSTKRHIGQLDHDDRPDALYLHRKNGSSVLWDVIRED
jgi:hypothetical protein